MAHRRLGELQSHHRALVWRADCRPPPVLYRFLTFQGSSAKSVDLGSSIAYDKVTYLLKGGAAAEIQFEDRRREIKKVRDGALRLLRCATGKSELEEQHSDRNQVRDTEISEVFRRDQKKRW